MFHIGVAHLVEFP